MQKRKISLQKFLYISTFEPNKYDIQVDAILVLKLKLTVVLLVIEVKTIDFYVLILHQWQADHRKDYKKDPDLEIDGLVK